MAVTKYHTGITSLLGGLKVGDTLLLDADQVSRNTLAIYASRLGIKLVSRPFKVRGGKDRLKVWRIE
jgi:hypothetical protein